MSSPAVELSPTLIDAINSFGFDLYERLRTRPGNLAISPESLSVALALTLGGARGETAAQIAEVTHSGADRDDLHGACGALLAAWNDPERESYELRVANRLFAERAYGFEGAFLKLADECYGAPVEALDFRNSPDASRERINAWVAQQTNRRILEFLAPGTIHDLTRLILANAVYFLGQWLLPFDEEATAPRRFHLPTARSVIVPTMHRTAWFGYAEIDGLQVLEMSYTGQELTMTVLLPRARDGLAGLEKWLTVENLRLWTGRLRGAEVAVALPRFVVDPACLSLGETLASMGMPLVFDRHRADLTGIAKPPDPADRLFLDDVCHKVFVAVDEKGTEATAVTSPLIMATAAMIQRSRPEPPVFRADHPFIFLIRQRGSGAILFLGRVEDPRESA